MVVAAAVEAAADNNVDNDDFVTVIYIKTVNYIKTNARKVSWPFCISKQMYHKTLKELTKQFIIKSNSILFQIIQFDMPGCVAQSVTCLATDACLTADPGVASSIPVRSHTFVEIDHKWFLLSFSSLPLIHSRRVIVSYKRKYVHELLVNRLFKPAQEKVWWGELTVPQWP